MELAPARVGMAARSGMVVWDWRRGPGWTAAAWGASLSGVARVRSSPRDLGNDLLMDRLVEVAVPLPLRDMYTYTVPDGLAALVAPGARVQVPFGRRGPSAY